ncbi:unnamed protein product [Arctogadus glacialis]
MCPDNQTSETSSSPAAPAAYCFLLPLLLSLADTRAGAQQADSAALGAARPSISISFRLPSSGRGAGARRGAAG